MRVVFRVDASTKMGSGHVMRCLTLAEELKKDGADITFISRSHEGNLNEFISKNGIEVVALSEPETFEHDSTKIDGDDYSEWLGVSQEQDAEESIKTLVHDPSDWLIVDHYGLDETWEKMIRPHVKNIMVIDDLANRRHDCDILLDQNWFEDMVTRYDGLVPVGCTKLLGPEYALLRPEFAKARKKLNPHNGNVKRIFVFFGGSDPHNLTSMTLRALSEPALAYLKVDLVIGENNPHHNELKKLTAFRASTYLHVQVDDMASIMTNADLAIGSGGVNTWERMCLGIPSLIISFADNHIIMLQDLVQHGFVNFLGNITNVDEFVIKKGVLDIISDRSLIKDQSIKIYKLVDGSGSQTVTDWLIGDLSNKNWEVKSTTNEYMELYWVWANDKQVRKNSINKEPIPFNIHKEWFHNKLVDNNCSLYLILIDKHPVGQVRFENEGNFARIDYSIARQFRGRKLGKKILDEAIKEYQIHSDKKILGEVLPNNIASAKTFESLGFSMETNKGKKIYTKESKDLAKVNA